MDHRLLHQGPVDVLLLETDQERSLGNDARQVAGIPAPVLQKQVFILCEAQQRHRPVTTPGRILAEEQRVLALQLGIFGHEGRHNAHRIAEFRTKAQDHAQVVMRHVVEHCVSRHLKLQQPSVAEDCSHGGIRSHAFPARISMLSIAKKACAGKPQGSNMLRYCEAGK